MSSKLEELRRNAAGNISESMGGGRIIGGGVPGEHRPVIRGADPRHEGVKRRADVSDIPLEKIVPDPDQPRRSFTDTPEEKEELEALSQSLATIGQIQPVTVYWSDDLQRYGLISGERRFRASLMAGLATLTCIVVARPLTPGKRLSAQIQENLHRRGLKPMEAAQSYRKLMEIDGLNQTQLSEMLTIPRSTVVKTLALLDLPDDLKDKVSAGELSPTVAYQVSRVEGEDAQRAMAERVVTEGLSRDETERAVKQVTPGGRTSGRAGGTSKSRPRAVKLPTERKHKAGNGLRVVVTGRKGFDVPATIEALEDALVSFKARLGREGGAEDHDAA